MGETSGVQWTHILESLIGTFAGAFVALCSMWIKELMDRHKAVQDCFEQSYITEGLDPVRSYLSLAETYISLNPRSTENLGPLKEFLGDPPLQALERVRELVGGNFAGALDVAVFTLGGVRPSDRGFTIHHLGAIRRFISDLLVSLTLLHRILIEVKVNKKSDIYEFHKKVRLRALLDRVTENVDTAMSRFKKGMAKGWEDVVANETSERPIAPSETDSSS